MQVHSPSEHQIDGQSYDVEIQWVHAIEDEDLTKHAVISYMFDVKNGDADGNSTLIGELLKNYNEQSPDQFLPSNFSSSCDYSDLTSCPMIDVGKFFEDVDTVNFYNYVGTKTTPPCDPDYEYFIMKQIQPITEEQLENLKKYTNSYYQKDNDT